MESVVAMSGGTRFRAMGCRVANQLRDGVTVDYGMQIGRVSLYLGLFTLVAHPAAAQSVGESFCETALAETLMNLFQVIQFGGPLVGGVIALGATVVLPTVRRSDLKREIKELRNRGILWGVIVAPLGTTIIQFLLSNVVAGGASCSF
jgi:hypothetical protein